MKHRLLLFSAAAISAGVGIGMTSMALDTTRQDRPGTQMQDDQAAMMLTGDANPRFAPMPLQAPVFDNGGPDGTNGLSHFEGVLGGDPYDRVLADDFELADDEEISRVQMSGVWFDHFPAPGPLTAIRVRFWEDNNGEPGALIDDQPGLSFTAVDTGGTFFDRPEVRYTVDIAPVSLVANTPYWVSIQPTGTTDNFFHLTSATGAANLFGEQVHVGYPDSVGPCPCPWPTPGNVVFNNVFYDVTFQLFPPPPDTALSLNPNPGVCYEPGDTVTVIIDMTDAQDVIVGGQYRLEYDPTMLLFVSASPASPPSPFTFEVYFDHDVANSWIDYATGVQAGQPGTSDDHPMAVLEFIALAETCSTSDLVFFRPNVVPPTRLSDEFGNEVLPDLFDLSAITVDDTPPVLTLPPDDVVECDSNHYAPSGDCAGNCGGMAPSGCWCDNACDGFGDCCPGVCTDCPGLNFCSGEATATDNCTAPNDIVITFTDNIVPGACPQEFTIEREWTATDACGNSSSGVQIIEVVDTTAPQVPWPQGDITINADAGGCTAVVTWADPVAGVDYFDNCTDPADILVTSSHNPGDVFTAAGSPYTVTYTFEDECGNMTVHTFDVTVNAVNDFRVDLELAGTFTTTFTRCVTFEFSGNDSAVFEQEVTFVNGAATNVLLEIPCGDYDCVTARDKLHTLRSFANVTVSGTEYEAALTGMDALVSGDLNDDGMIDILDFAVFVWQWQLNVGPNTDCTQVFIPGVFAHADLDGDGFITPDDVQIIIDHFFMLDAVCPSPLGLAGGDLAAQPLERVSVEELNRRGLGHLAVADLNGDGWIDAADIALFRSNRR